MSIPDFSDLRPQSDTTTEEPEQSNIPDFSDLSGKKSIGQSYKDLWNSIEAIGATLSPTPNSQQALLAAKYAESPDTFVPTAEKFLGDVGQTALEAAAAAHGIMLPSLQEKVNTAAQDILEKGKKLPGEALEKVTHPAQTFKDILSAVATAPATLTDMIAVQPVNDALSGILGIDPVTLNALTPEQRAQTWKNTAANVVTAGLIGASKAAGLLEVNQFSPNINRILTGVKEGIIGGAAYSSISQANDPHQLSAMMSSMVAFSAFGAASELMFGKGGTNVSNLGALRKLIAEPTKTIPEIQADIEAIGASSSIDEAAGRSAAVKDKAGLVPSDRPLEVLHGAEGNGIISDNGKVVLVNPEKLEPWMFGPSNLWKPDESRYTFFKKTGYLQNQIVSWKGADYTLKDITLDGKAILADGQTLIGVPWEQIRGKSDIQGEVSAYRVSEHEPFQYYQDIKRQVADNNRDVEGWWNGIRNYEQDSFLKNTSTLDETRQRQELNYRIEKADNGTDIRVWTGGSRDFYNDYFNPQGESKPFNTLTSEQKSRIEKSYNKLYQSQYVSQYTQNKKAAKANEAEVATAISHATAPEIDSTGTHVINTGIRFTKGQRGVGSLADFPKISTNFINDVAHSQWSADFSNVVNEMFPQIFQCLKERFDRPKNEEVKYVGIGVTPEAFGISHEGGLIGRQTVRNAVEPMIGIKEDDIPEGILGRGRITRSVELNPFLTSRSVDMYGEPTDLYRPELLKAAGAGSSQGMGKSTHMVGTIIHEIVHNWWGHGSEEAKFTKMLKAALVESADIADKYGPQFDNLFAREDFKNLAANYNGEYAAQSENAARYQNIAKALIESKAQRDLQRAASISKTGLSEQPSLYSEYSKSGEGFGSPRGNTPTGERERSGADVERIGESALSNKMYVSDDGTTARDLETGQIITKAADSGKLQASIDKSGQAEDVELLKDDNGGIIPPPVNAKELGPPLPPRQPHIDPSTIVQPVGGLERVIKSIEASRFSSFMVNKIAAMKAFDSLTGTRLNALVIDTVRPALIKFSQVMNEWSKPVNELFKHGKDLANERWNVVGRWLETASDQEIRAGALTGDGKTPMPQVEQNIAEQWAGYRGGETIDLKKVTIYRRYQDKINAEWAAARNSIIGKDAANSNDPMTQMKLQQVDQGFQEQLKSLPDVHSMSLKELQAVEDYRKILKGFTYNDPLFGEQKIGPSSLYRISMLYKVLANPELNLDRDNFAARNQMTPAELNIAQQVEGLYKSAGKALGIEDYRMINRYMAHMREYGEMPMSPEFLAVKNKIPLDVQYSKMAEFQNDKVRTGEIDDYIEHPLAAFAQYIYRGMKDKMLNPVVKQAARDARTEFKNLAATKPEYEQQYLRDVVNQYLDGVTGRRRVLDTEMQNTIDIALDNLGQTAKDKKSETARNLTNALINWTSSGLIGGKPELALRDFYTAMTLHETRFGGPLFGRTMDVFRTIANGNYKWAIEKGLVPGLDINDFRIMQGALDATDVFSDDKSTSKHLADASSKIGNFFLNFNGQKSIFQLLHAANYVEGFENAASNLKKFYDGKIDAKGLSDNTHLWTYDKSTQNDFINLVNKGSMEDAAHFLARQKSLEVAFDHGMSEHPYLWNSNLGRLFGQMGVYPTNSLNYLARIATRGTPAQRAWAVSKWVSLTALTKGAGLALGLDLSNWSSVHGLKNGIFAGGPLMPWNQTSGNPYTALTGLIAQNSGGQPTREEAQNMSQFFGSLGWKYQDGEWQFDTNRMEKGFKYMWVPGSYAFHNMIDAIHLANGGKGKFTSAARLFGFNMAPDNRDFLNAYDTDMEAPERGDNYPVMDIINPFSRYIRPRLQEH